MPDAGMPSLFDYAGYPVGMVPVADCGYDGIIDWTGLLCGLSITVPPTPIPEPPIPSGGGGEVASRRRRKPISEKERVKRKKDDAEAIALAALFLWR